MKATKPKKTTTIKQENKMQSKKQIKHHYSKHKRQQAEKTKTK